MGQYRPAHRVGRRGENGRPAFAEINRAVNPQEMTILNQAAPLNYQYYGSTAV